MAASGILFGQTFMQDKLCNNSESGEMEHHHQVRHIGAGSKLKCWSAAAVCSILGRDESPSPGPRTVASAKIHRPADGSDLQISDGDC